MEVITGAEWDIKDNQANKIKTNCCPGKGQGAGGERGEQEVMWTDIFWYPNHCTCQNNFNVFNIYMYYEI